MNNSIYPCIFIMKSYMGFAIVVVYMNDLNPVETLKEFIRTTDHLKKKFEMKDFRKTKFFIGL